MINQKLHATIARSLQFLFEIAREIDKHSCDEILRRLAEWAKKCNFTHIPNARQISIDITKVMGDATTIRKNGMVCRGYCRVII